MLSDMLQTTEPRDPVVLAQGETTYISNTQRLERPSEVSVASKWSKVKSATNRSNRARHGKRVEGRKIFSKYLLSLSGRIERFNIRPNDFPYSIVVEFLNKAISVLVVNSQSKVSRIADRVRQLQEHHVLSWPHSRHQPLKTKHASNRVLSKWTSPVALKISHEGSHLDQTKTLGELNLGPFSHLQAHMYFSQCSPSRNNTSAMHNQAQAAEHGERTQQSKRTWNASSFESRQEDRKRQKYNDPVRNRHIHGMFEVSQKLEVSVGNAARYGLDVDDLEDLLSSLDMAGEGV